MNLLFYLFYKLIKIYITIIIISFILSFFFKNPSNEHFLSKKAITGQSYSIFDLARDYNENKILLRKIINSPFLFFIFNIIIICIFTIRPVLVFISFLFMIYFLIKIIRYYFSNDYVPIKLEVRVYEFNNYYSWLDVLKLFFYSIPKWCGWVVAYSLLKTIFIKQKAPLDVYNYIGTALMNFIIGISGWSIFASYHLSERLQMYLRCNYTLSFSIKSVLINGFTSEFNKFMIISKKLKIYKVNKILVFNPFNETKKTSNLINKSFINENKFPTLLKIYSPTLEGGQREHPGYVAHFNLQDTNSFSNAIQLTGKPIEGMKSVIFEAKGYKTTESHNVYNIMQLNKNLKINSKGKFFESLGVYTTEGRQRYLTIMASHSMHVDNLPLICEYENYKECRHAPNGVTDFIIKNNDLRVDYYTLKHHEILNEVKEKTPFNDLKDVNEYFNSPLVRTYNLHDQNQQFDEIVNYNHNALLNNQNYRDFWNDINK